MDILLLIVGFVLVLVGIAGAFLPVIPGPLTSWFGLLLLYMTKSVPNNTSFLVITLLIALIVFVLDYVVPPMATKKFGGTKFGVGGSMIGLIIGLGFGPLGIILGPLLGAFAGEYLKDSTNKKRAVNAAVGSFIGFLFSTTLKFAVSLIFTILFIKKFWMYKAVFFGMN